MKTEYIPTCHGEPIIELRFNQYNSESDAYVAAISNGTCELRRDEDGYMSVRDADDNHLYSGGSYKANDAEAKQQTVRKLALDAGTMLDKFGVLTVARDDSGMIVSVDGDDDAELLTFWASRL